MSLAKRMAAVGQPAPTMVQPDPPYRRIVMPYRLEGTQGQVRVGSRIRDRVLNKAHWIEPWYTDGSPPQWFLEIMMIRSAAWWCGLGFHFWLLPDRLIRSDGRPIKPHLIRADLF
jgi:hypothetical protein